PIILFPTLHPIPSLFFFPRSGAHRDLPSFPTRRSSDLRGLHPSMYRGRLWTMRQYAGFGTAEQTNARFRHLLKEGQTGLSVAFRSEEHTSELQSRGHLVCRLLLEKKKKKEMSVIDDRWR